MSNTLIGRALTLTWLLSIALIGVYASEAVHNAIGAVYLLAVTVLQASMLMIPLFILQLLHRRTGKRWLAAIIYLLSFGLIVLLASNYKLHSMYNFFIDGFVINLMTTPGGIDALGLSPSFYSSAAIALGLGAFLYALTVRFVPLERALNFHSKRLFLSLGFLLLFTGEALSYAWASYTSAGEILSVSSKVVWHIPVTARSFFKNLGIAEPDSQLKGNGEEFLRPIFLSRRADTHWSGTHALQYCLVNLRISAPRHARRQNNAQNPRLCRKKHMV